MRAGKRIGRAEFLIWTARGGDRAGLRVRNDCGFRARLCSFYCWPGASIEHMDGTDSLTRAHSAGNTRTGLRAVLCGHVSHVEKKCDYLIGCVPRTFIPSARVMHSAAVTLPTDRLLGASAVAGGHPY